MIRDPEPRSMRSRCVIVAGFARSGTSWLGKGLSFAPGFTYYREPDNDHRIADTDEKERFAWLYLTPSQDDPEYLRLMTRACSGQIATALTMADDPGPILKHLGARGLRLGERFPVLFCRQPHALLKLTYANLNLTWLRARPVPPGATGVHPASSMRPVRKLAGTGLEAGTRQAAVEPAIDGGPSTPIRVAPEPGKQLLGAGRGSVGSGDLRHSPPNRSR